MYLMRNRDFFQGYFRGDGLVVGVDFFEIRPIYNLNKSFSYK